MSTALVAVFVGLWIVGTCSAAMTCDSPCKKHDMSSGMTAPCEHESAAPCDTPIPDTPTSSSFSFSIPLVVLTVLTPIDAIATQIVRVPPESWQATRPPATPLYLTHLALLN